MATTNSSTPVRIVGDTKGVRQVLFAVRHLQLLSNLRVGIGPVSVSRYMARLRATGADLGTGHKNNIRWMTVVTSD